MGIHTPPNRVASISAAGTTGATATTINTKHALIETITAATARGVILSDAMAVDEVWGTVHNGTTEMLELYPPSGATFNGATADEAMTIGPHQGVMWVKFTATKYSILVS